MTPAAASRVQTAPPLAPRRRVGAPTRPRRVSGPVRPPAARPNAPGARPRAAEGGLALGLLGLAGKLDSLASHRLLDRLIRSRVWIGIVAFALIGIVTLQLGLLKMNSGIGRALERENALQRDNAALSIENSELATGSRVESQAERLGMRLASIGGLKFLGSHARTDVGRAAAALQAAPAQEAAAPAPEAVSSEAEAGSGSGSEEGEAAASEGTSEAGSSSETAAGSSEGASEAGSGETSEASAGSEASSEAVPAGEGGGAAAPGG